LKSKNPCRHESDRNPKEENQNLETGKTSADTPQSRFSIPKGREKTTSPTQKGRENTTSPVQKGREKHHPFTSKEPAKPEERKKFIEKQIYHKPLGRREAESNTLKRYFCLQREKIASSSIKVDLWWMWIMDVMQKFLGLGFSSLIRFVLLE
jgi:hypothetical protein